MIYRTGPLAEGPVPFSRLYLFSLEMQMVTDETDLLSLCLIKLVKFSAEMINHYSGYSSLLAD